MYLRYCQNKYVQKNKTTITLSQEREEDNDEIYPIFLIDFIHVNRCAATGSPERREGFTGHGSAQASSQIRKKSETVTSGSEEREICS